MMMDESEERYTRDPKDRATLALPLLSRDNNTWEQFQGASIVADTAHRGMHMYCCTCSISRSSVQCAVDVAK